MATLKQRIKNALARRNVFVTRIPKALIDANYPLVLSVELLAQLLPNHGIGATFVQVGAYDGESGDPLVGSAISRNWLGVLVEPQPRAFAKLQKLYEGRPNFILRNVAISHKSETRTLYTFRDEPALPLWAYQVASFEKTHLLKQQSSLPGFNVEVLIEPVAVKCITFDELLEDVRFAQVDILQIDTEGFDYEILRLFDLRRRQPSIVNFEHSHLSMIEWNGAVELLLDSGYQVARVGVDTLAFSPSNRVAELK